VNSYRFRGELLGVVVGSLEDLEDQFHSGHLLEHVNFR
jgi:hypothetical protein